MKEPRKAIVLCAGFASRMRPLSQSLPKALMPVWNKPVLEYNLELLESWGVKEVLINTHHLPAMISEYIRNRTPSAIRPHLSYEPEILGTGGALQKAEWFLDNEPFWIINGDVLADLSPLPLIKEIGSQKTIASLWLTTKAGPRTVETSKRGVITEFNSSHPGNPGTYTFCGLHLVSPKILEHIPGRGFSSIIDAYRKAMSKGHKVKGVVTEDSFWADTGTVDGYLNAHADILKTAPGLKPTRRGQSTTASLKRSGIIVKGFASLGSNVQIKQGTEIRNSVIWDNVKISAKSRIENAVIASGTKISGNISGMIMPIEASCNDLLLQAIISMGWKTGDTAAMFLPARGSARSFTRLTQGKSSAIAIEYSLDRPENALYQAHQRLLRKIGVRVPDILIDMPKRHLAVVEDVGDVSLKDAIISRKENSVLKHYKNALDSIITLHEKGMNQAIKSRTTLNEPFSASLYRWEHNLFKTFFMDNSSIPDRVVRGVMRNLLEVSQTLCNEPNVLLHRDLQSSNILIFKGETVLIDFQGMRKGPALYDIASLICDPYVSLPQAIRKKLLAYYAQASDQSSESILEVFPYAAIQRLVQALGAFGRLSMNRETSRFSNHIKPALKMLNQVLIPVDRLPYLKEAVHIALANNNPINGS